VLGGTTNPTGADLKKILDSVGVEAEDAQIELLIKELSGKDVFQVIESGKSKLAAVPSGGGGAAPAPAGGAAPAPAGGKPADAGKKDDKKDDKKDKKDDAGDVGDLFGGDDDDAGGGAGLGGGLFGGDDEDDY